MDEFVKEVNQDTVVMVDPDSIEETNEASKPEVEISQRVPMYASFSKETKTPEKTVLKDSFIRTRKIRRRMAKLSMEKKGIKHYNKKHRMEDGSVQSFYSLNWKAYAGFTENLK